MLTTTMELAKKYAVATGKLLGTMSFLASYDSMTADEIRADLKKKIAEVEAELDETQD
jgi:hypothetical protein